MSCDFARSTIKWVDIRAPKEKVFAFLADPMNWPRYAIVNLRSVNAGPNGWYHMITKHGAGQIKVHANEELGILDHTWKDPQATWNVPSRVVANGDGATVTLTIFKPSLMNDEQFDSAMKEMDLEMAQLKQILEAN